MRRTETLEGRHHSYFRKEMNRGAGRENVRKQRGKDKAQNTEGRRDFGAWGKVKKMKRGELGGGLQRRSENRQM